MKNDKNRRFIELVEELYGAYSYESALFGSTNYSKIATELCYSNSHFTKLISGGASEPMYERAIKNVNRLIKTKTISENLQNRSLKSGRVKKIFFGAIASCFAIIALLAFNINKKSSTNRSMPHEGTHPMDMYFNFHEASYFKSPYLSEEQVHKFCPGSAYEGRWQLEGEYIIPIPYKVPGLYYVGKSADIRLKCRINNAEKRGQELIGFENIKNEIWFDQSKTPISPKYFNKSTNAFTKEFMELDFEKSDNFVKIANVYSCFYDEILIRQDSIFRAGEPCGRYAKSENDDILAQYDLDLNHIIEYIIGKMVFAQCDPIENIYCDPNNLLNGVSELSFPCECSINTENLGLGGSYPYIKSIKLSEQNYQSNLMCTCEE